MILIACMHEVYKSYSFVSPIIHFDAEASVLKW